MYGIYSVQLCLIHHQQYLNSLINSEIMLADTEGVKQVNPNILTCTIREGVALCVPMPVK